MTAEPDRSTTPDATQQVIPEEFLDLLDSTALAHIATIGPTGAPQVSPVWFGWDGTHVRFSQLPNAQKLKNLQRDNRVALSIVDPTNDYRYLEVRGRVIAIEPDPDYTCLSQLAGKYWGLDTYPYREAGKEPVIIVIEPLKTTSMNMAPPSTD